MPGSAISNLDTAPRSPCHRGEMVVALTFDDGPSVEALASASRVYGAGRLLFGTDYPYCGEPQFRHHLSYLSEAGLDTAELDQITGGTAATLLHATGPTA